MKRFIAIIALFMMIGVSYGATVTPAPMPKLQFLNNSGAVLSGGKIYTYEPGSTSPKTTYTDSTGNTANTNPVVLDSSGRANIWIDGCVKFIVKTSADATLYTVDNVCEYATTVPAFSMWQDSGLTPTYVGATSFSFPGDQTGSYETGMRLKTTNSGGTIYSTIVSAVYGSVTTITVINDSGSLDSGLSDVDYSIFTVSNSSAPVPPVATKTGGYTILPTDCGKTLISNLSSTATFTLPAANAVPSGCEIVTKNTSTWTLTIAGTVDGVANPTILSQYGDFRLKSNGTSWYAGGTGKFINVPTFSNGLISSGTMTGTATGIELLEEKYATSNTSATSLDLGTVSVGDRIFIFMAGTINWSTRPTSYHGSLAQSAGTATIKFTSSRTNIQYALYENDNASSNATGSSAAIVQVTGSGTLTLQQGIQYLSGSGISFTNNDIYAFYLRKR